MASGLRGVTDGQIPTDGLTFGAAGNIYGTTLSSSLYTCEGILGCGIAFEITPWAKDYPKPRTFPRRPGQTVAICFGAPVEFCPPTSVQSGNLPAS